MNAAVRILREELVMLHAARQQMVGEIERPGAAILLLIDNINSVCLQVMEIEHALEILEDAQTFQLSLPFDPPEHFAS